MTSPAYRLACVDDEVAMSYYENQCVVVGDEMDGIVTYGENWIDFYFQSLSATEILADLQLHMNELYDTNDFPSISDTPAFCKGAPCVARYSSDNKWYRARLIDFTDYGVVFFVDYGNKQMVNLENVKPLTRTLAEITPPLALHCNLANMQTHLLPSFVKNSDIITVTIQSKHEPYQVSVQVKAQLDRQQFPNSGFRSNNNNNGNNFRYNNSDSGGRRPTARTREDGAQQQQHRNPAERSNARSNSKVLSDGEEDDIEKLKSQNKRVYISSTAGKLSVSGAAGTITKLYATCGQITPPDGHFRSFIFQFNSQETTFHNGVLDVENLGTIFHTGDRMIFNARFEDPLPKESLAKISKAPSGYYQITDMQMVPSTRFMISHATVTFVSNQGVGLYIRSREQSVFAPVSSFTHKKPDASLAEYVELGRSVLLRALPAEHCPDYKVTAEWIAQSVSFLGNVVESEGWMYFVRDNYTVIITEGGIGFGYVFVQNQFVESAGIPQAMWYGTRALFRACVDVPDRENFHYGARWKAMSVRLLPEHSRGAYKYPGIYRPPPMSMYELPLATGKKILDSDEVEDNFDLPEDVLKEMRVMGKDSIGVRDSAQHVTQRNELTDNMLNEREEQQSVNVKSNIKTATAIQPSVPNGTDARSAAIEVVVQESDPISLHLNAATLLDDMHGNIDIPPVEVLGPESSIDDLLGLNFGGSNEATQIGSTIVKRKAQVFPPERTALDELMDLWEGCSSKTLTPSINSQRKVDQIDATASFNGHSANDRNFSPFGTTQMVNGDLATSLSNSSLETGSVSSKKTTRDQSCQPSDDDQLREEIQFLRDSGLFTQVISHVTTLPKEVEQKFYALLARLG